jgi:hypothetical protein
MRYQLCLCMLLLGSPVLRASQFSFSYSGVADPLLGSPYQVTASGTLTAQSVGNGVYDVTNISGTRNGVTIVDSGIGNLGILYMTNGVLGLGNSGFLEFGLGHGATDTVAYTGSVLEEVLVSTSPSVATISKFSVTVPEPSTVLIFLTLGLVVWAFGRKLPTRLLHKR